jgi:hypothetical protein
MLTSSTCKSTSGSVNTATIHPNLAVFAAHLATSLPLLAPILPLLPPITRNVKLHLPAKRLEFRIQAHAAAHTKSKSGKNGNVDWRGQLCRSPVLHPLTSPPPPSPSVASVPSCWFLSFSLSLPLPSASSATSAVPFPPPPCASVCLRVPPCASVVVLRRKPRRMIYWFRCLSISPPQEVC